MRALEGESLLRDFQNRMAALRGDLEVVCSRRGAVVEEYRDRLAERIKLLLGGAEPDENRLMQEIAFIIDRADINEETVRLESHLDQVHALVTGEKPADGRRLDFIIQELHRETNTIGSKTADLGDHPGRRADEDRDWKTQGTGTRISSDFNRLFIPVPGPGGFRGFEFFGAKK